MSPRQRRYKLLLDEMLPRREKLPELNRTHDLKHIVHDLGKSGLSDKRILVIAKRQNRIVVTKNVRDFQGLCTEKGVDMVGVTEALLPEELDKKIMAYLRRRTAGRMTGTYHRITHSPRRRR